MKKITLIDDNPSDTDLVLSCFNSNPKYSVIKTFHSGVDAIKNLDFKCDYFLIDMHMPLLNGLDTSILLMQKGFIGKILIISHGFSHNDLLKSKEIGVSSYCRKDKDIIFSTLSNLETDSKHFDENKITDWSYQTSISKLFSLDVDKRIQLLTPQYKKILHFSCKGYNTAEIGELIGLKKHTVDQYRATMLQLLEFKNIGQATAWAIANHVIEHSEVVVSINNKNQT